MPLPPVIDLRAPSGRKIVGALTNDGDICKVTCRFFRNGDEPNFMYEFASGDMGRIPKDDAAFRLVDEDGRQWPRGDVEWESMPPAR